MIKNLNESIKFDEKSMQLFEELEGRPEMICSGQVRGVGMSVGAPTGN